MARQTPAQDYVLGLDIGTNSVGWAAVEQKDGRPVKLLRAGVRVFDAGVDGDIESGRDESRAVKRRQARLRRRMLERRTRRLKKLAHLLQDAGLLPPGDLKSEEARIKFYAELDNKIFSEPARKQHPHTLPYLLRAKALDKKLSEYELGRAIYHLAQRRGFLSNRKAAKKDKDDDEGVVKEAIGELAKKMESSKARTLGEYLSRLNPELERIRARWTARKMYEDEFEAIWKAQQPHHAAILKDELKKRVKKVIFFQRPLRWDRATIGDCELEPGKRRAPLAILDAQRFRLLQKVNDLRIGGYDETTGEPLDRAMDKPNLTPEERKKLAAALEAGDMTFPKVRKLLGLPKWVTFNYQESDPKLLGNRTAGHLRDVFGEKWDGFSAEEKNRVVEDALSIQKPEAQYKRGIRAWGLKEGSKEAEAFGDLALEPGHCSLSREAIKKLLPLMEKGMSYATARKQLYGDRPGPKPADELPSLADAAIPEIRNPAVSRSLTEVRKVVNSILREHGKPAEIRIELARDLKKNRKERKAISKRNFDKRNRREDAVAKLLSKAGIQQPSGADIEKWLLAEECGWVCPYTGKQINAGTLFGRTPQFDVEHIIPFSRCLDNSFLNKTLCDHDFNVHEKRNRTPWECFQASPEKWEKIGQRVKAFKGDAAVIKLERFQLKDLESFDTFTERQLADTRYASLLAIEYLGLLYGTGAQGVDADHTRRIQAGRGQATKYLRDVYELNRILGDGGGKNRDDHRHHAVDAVCIALTDAGTVKALSDASEKGWYKDRPGWLDRKYVKAPWSSFFEDVKAAIGELVVSHRVFRKVGGALHDETIYSKEQKDNEGRECVHVRKLLDERFTAKLVDDIVDPVVRECVRGHLKKHGDDPKKAFSDPTNHPKMKSGMPVHKVRIRKYESTMLIAAGARGRRVMSGSNHHVEIFECLDKKGESYWNGAVVTTMEAMRRLRAGEPIIKRDHGEGRNFRFSLAQGETLSMKDKDSGTVGIYVVTGISEGEISLLAHTDARPSNILRKTKGARIRPAPDTLRILDAEKVTVGPTGEVRRAND